MSQIIARLRDPEASAQVDRLFGADPVSRWDEARRLYEAVGANATFLLVDQVGHDLADADRWAVASLRSDRRVW